MQCGNSVLPLDRTPKILGVTLDPSLTFTPHTKEIKSKCTKRLNVLKALAGTSWGQQKETLTITYNSLIKPIITYAAPIWFPSTCKSNIESLQVIQNKCLRTITGSHNMADTHHLHSETKILPVETHLRMLCSQFLVSSLRTHHPSYRCVTAPSGPRASRRIPTLQSRFLGDVQHYLEGGATPSDSYGQIIKDIHRTTVNSFRSLQTPNKLLNRPAPEISEEEMGLPRHYRTTLSQLRSSYCSRLLNYRYRVGLSDSDICPECGLEPHTAEHLFECTSHPTSLSPESLWTHPVEVAAHLREMSAFGDLPPLSPAPPRPPPEPPPT